MLSSSPTSFAPQFFVSSSSSSSSSSLPLSPVSQPSRVSRISPSLSTTTASYTYAKNPPKLRTQHLSATASLYEILDIPVDSTIQEIKSAYRRLARICHPDVVGTGKNNSSEVDFMKIHSAYCTLSDPEKRAVYDGRLIRRNRPMSVGVSGYGNHGGRNWETDQCW